MSNVIQGNKNYQIQPMVLGIFEAVSQIATGNPVSHEQDYRFTWTVNNCIKKNQKTPQQNLNWNVSEKSCVYRVNLPIW